MNPEFRRNLWLEFSLHRLIAAPAVVALLLVLVATASAEDWLWNVARVGGWVFGLAVLPWGTHLASGAVSTEARERTWDAQRMSAIGPWAMTWGKLLGAPAFAWYVGLFVLPVFVAGGQARAGFPALRLALLLAMAAPMLHATALTASIYAARKQFRTRAAGTLLVWLLAPLLLPAWRLADGVGADLVWWGAAFDVLDFALASTAAFAAWAVLGAYRSMCTALEIRTRPWALPAFTVFAAVWASGLLPPDAAGRFGGLLSVPLCAVAISGAFCYALLLAEPAGASAWQRLRARLRARHLRRALEEAPLWLIALVTGLFMAVAALSAFPGSDSTSRLMPLAAMLFVIRDAAIFQFFALARQPRRAEAAAVFYLAVLYGLLPGLLTALEAKELARWILPKLFTESGFATVVMLAQAGIAVAVAWWRWNSVHAPDTARAGEGPSD